MMKLLFLSGANIAFTIFRPHSILQIGLPGVNFPTSENFQKDLIHWIAHALQIDQKFVTFCKSSDERQLYLTFILLKEYNDQIKLAISSKRIWTILKKTNSTYRGYSYDSKTILNLLKQANSKGKISTRFDSFSDLSFAEDQAQLMNKLNEIRRLLRTTSDLCPHELAALRHRIESWMNLRLRCFPWKQLTWKEHQLYYHVFDFASKQKTVGRFGEDFGERCHQLGKKAWRRTRFIKTPEMRVSKTMHHMNLMSTSMKERDRNKF